MWHDIIKRGIKEIELQATYVWLRMRRTEVLFEFSCFDVSLTVHLIINLPNDQPDAQIFLIYLLRSSTCTCFEQYLAHP